MVGPYEFCIYFYICMAFISSQEYIEAVSFLHYLQGGGLLTPQIADRDFVFPCEDSAGETSMHRDVHVEVEAGAAALRRRGSSALLCFCAAALRCTP